MKTRKLKRSVRESVWLEARWRGRVWLVQRGASGIWAGLWSLPEFESLDALHEATRAWPGRSEALATFKHVLTHLDWHLQPVRWTFPERTPASRTETCLAPWPEGRWFTLEEALALGLPAPLRKRLEAAETAAAA